MLARARFLAKAFLLRVFSGFSGQAERRGQAKREPQTSSATGACHTLGHWTLPGRLLSIRALTSVHEAGGHPGASGGAAPAAPNALPRLPLRPARPRGPPPAPAAAPGAPLIPSVAQPPPLPRRRLSQRRPVHCSPRQRRPPPVFPC